MNQPESHSFDSLLFLAWLAAAVYLQVQPDQLRLFPHVARACQGIIFKTPEQVRRYMNQTKTRTGLSVVANIVNKVYERGRKVVEGFKKTMRILFDTVLPHFNYRAIPTTG